MSLQHIKYSNGTMTGGLTINIDTSGRGVDIPASISIQNADGTYEVLTASDLTAVSNLGDESIANSTATDVAGIVSDFNALLVSLATMGVIVQP